MDDPTLAALGRVHTLGEAREAARAVREAGLALSVDLIFALPVQTVEAWRSTLQRAVRELEPGHVSAYELSLEPGTPMHRAVELGDLTLPTEDEAARMFVAADEELARLGFEHYEISNYARPGARSRHNANYWERGTYLALGPSAHGFNGRERWWNVPDVGQYVRLVGSGRLPEAGRALVSPEEAAREWLMLGLRTSDGLSLDEGESHGLHGLEAEARPLADDGLLRIEGGRVSPTLGGMLLCNALAVRLMERLGL
jgi:oxygen-independent coproporphyrinogen-3 oxidase